MCYCRSITVWCYRKVLILNGFLAGHCIPNIFGLTSLRKTSVKCYRSGIVGSLGMFQYYFRKPSSGTVSYITVTRTLCWYFRTWKIIPLSGNWERNVVISCHSVHHARWYFFFFDVKKWKLIFFSEKGPSAHPSHYKRPLSSFLL